MGLIDQVGAPGRSESPLLPGATIAGRYRIERLLGVGGAGAAYLVEDRRTGRSAVLKLMHGCGPERLEALRTEFNLLRRFRHPHLVSVLDFARLAGSDATDRAYLTAEFVPGRSLSELLQDEHTTPRWSELGPVLVDALSALGLLHRAGIVHGDFTPANVIMRTDGAGVLIDLSCASAIGTHPASISGTRGFIAPESLSGSPVDHRTDLFAVGVTLQAVLARVVDEVDSPIRRIAARLVKQDPAERPTDVAEVLEALGVDVGAQAPIPIGLGRLAGRDAELHVCRHALSQLAGGNSGGRVLLIEGPESMGKTRLIEELRWEAEGQFLTLDANTNSPRAIPELLETALELEQLPNDIGSVLDAWERLRHESRRPVVLIVDDADQLGEHQLELLMGLIRSLEPTDPILVVASCERPLDVSTNGSVRLRLEPLSLQHVRHWLRESFSDAVSDRLWSVSGGVPGILRELLDDLASGALTTDALAEPDLSVKVSRRRLAKASLLSKIARRALLVLAIARLKLTDPALRALGVTATAEQELLESGLAVRDAAGLGLTRVAEGSALQTVLDQELHSSVHADVARWLAQCATSPELPRPACAELTAEAIHHLAQSGRVDDACERLRAAEVLFELAPRAFCRALSTLCELRDDAELELTLSRLEPMAGAAPKAHQRLQRLTARLAGTQFEAAVRLELAKSLLDQGAVSEAEAQLEQLAALGGEIGASASSALAKSLLRRGQYREAVAVAQRLLPECHRATEQAELLQTLALGHSFLGGSTLAQQELERASRLLSAQDRPRQLVRLNGVRAVVAYELGELDEAASWHAEAIRLASECGLMNQLATAQLNLATVHHQRGQWGDALSLYERCLRTAVAAGQSRTEALTRFNLAKLYLDLGLFERAAQASERCESRARAADLLLIAAEAMAVRGELELLRGNLGSARTILEAARDLAAQHGSTRECLELDLHLSELALLEGQPSHAATLLLACSKQAESAQAQDIRLRCRWLEARLELYRGDSASAARLAESLPKLAAEAKLTDLQGEAELLLAEIFDNSASPVLAHEHRTLARKVWEYNALSIPATLRPAYWAHPKRAPVQSLTPLATARPSRREQRLERMLEINQWLNSVLDANAVLERALDAALELSRAERGFVLLLDEHPAGPRFRVAVCRHLDRARLDRPPDSEITTSMRESSAFIADEQARFSRAIAERVVTSGVPVVTANALEDERFRGQKSVHAMKLRSVLCVPVVSPTATLGALYLDNRLERSRFDDEDLQSLLAFADQVAIALSNARLHADLAQRNQELELERGRVEELVRSQAVELERLAHEVECRKRDLERRFDYSQILGAGPAMQRLFALLDRVIETDLAVLIEGESGTGKELVARAIHTNDKRRSGSLVCINCAAMPDTLLEAELFGYEKGAFTGADRHRDGLFVQAHGGSLFLDELGELPLTMQAKLLRVLQEREVRPLGSERVIAVDVRLISATNRRLRDEVTAGRFREDLFYRVCGVEVALPPLRQRREDLPTLVQHFLRTAAGRLGRPVPDLTRQALDRLAAHSWPGNVRQLEHVVARAVALTDSSRITVADLDLPPERPASTLDRQGFELRESEQIAQALATHRFNVSKVSRLLGIPRATLWRKMKRYGLVKES